MWVTLDLPLAGILLPAGTGPRSPMFSTLDDAFELPAAEEALPCATVGAAPASPVTGVAATAEAPVTPVTYRLALYKPGSSVEWQGRDMTVSHVLLRRGRLMVYLQGHPDPVEPETLTMPLTRLVLQRT